MALSIGQVEALINLAMQRNAAYTFLWHNPAGYTPQQVCDLLGADAAIFFTFKENIEATIAATLPKLNLLADLKTHTVNDDGTVLINP